MKSPTVGLFRGGSKSSNTINDEENFLGESTYKRTITFESNCIIAIAKGEPTAPALNKLIEYHFQGIIEIAVVAISASEKRMDGSYPNSFKEFRERLFKVGLGTAKILPTLGYYDITYYDQSLFASDASIQLERSIHNILFPKSEFKWMLGSHKRTAQNLQYEKWRNRKCDVLGLWSHIHEKRDVFVTDDNNFFRASKYPNLIKLGAGKILRPQELVDLLSSEFPKERNT